MQNNLTFTPGPEGDRFFMVEIGGTYCGTIEIDVDGFYYYLPSPYSSGYYPGWFLKAVGEKLNELNKDWDEELRQALSGIPNEPSDDFDVSDGC